MMTWEQLKDELEEAVMENITVTMSPHTVLAIMQQVNDLQLLIKDFDSAVLAWMSSSDDENWPELLRDLVTVQEKIRELQLN